MRRRHCPTCTCTGKTSEATLVECIAAGVNAEGMSYFCEARCQSCDADCPRHPRNKKVVEEVRFARALDAISTQSK